MRIARLAPLALVALACRPTPAPTSNPGPRPPVSPPTVPTFERGITPRKAPPLPAIPLVEGPLEPKVVYPPANERISVDSNFIFGSVGNGHATLTINGANVPVAPNGTFLAFLPVPPPTAPRYELVARTATDSAHLEVPVRVPPPRVEFSATGPLIVDSGTVSPRGVSLALRDDEPVRVSVRAAPGATGWVLTSAKRRLPLVNTDAQHLATDVLARDLRSTTTLYVARDRDTVHFALSRVDSVETEPRYATLVPTGGGPDTDATIIGRSTPHGTYKWMLLPGTIVQVTGRNGDNARVRLDSQLETWVDAPNVRELPAGEPGPRRVIGAMALVPSPDWVDIVMPVSSPPPFLLEQDMTHLTLTMYGTEATPDIIKYLQNDSLVRVINWVPVATDRVRFDIELTEQPYGYLAMYDSARSAFVLRLRRAPVVSLAHPLQGLTITVDPGHPPGGAIGPTALTEAQGVLWVAEKLKTILEQRGAHVVMTRTTMDAVDLHERSVIARQTNSYALISVHLNAFGEGVDPFPNVGTSTLFFHPQTEPLARLVQAGMMREMGLRDLGIHYQNIAIGRTTWMPSLICEGAFLMVPEQENAIKTPAFQERYATGIADGLEAYFRTFAKR